MSKHQKKGKAVNKKDIQRLQEQESAEKVQAAADASFAYWTADALEKTIQKAVASALASARGKGRAILDEPWFRLYVAAVGGQMGWLVSSTDSAKLEKRLGILADIATSAVNHAVNVGKVAQK